MNMSADFLVIGGGVIGSSIAWHLSSRGVGKVLVLEKSFLGAGSSGKSGAIIRQHYSNRLTVEMARRSLHFFRDFDALVGGPSVFTQAGMVLVVSEKDKAGLETNIALQRECGVQVSLLSSEELAELDPNALLAEGELVAYEPEAGYVEAVQVVASFAEGARQQGTDIHQGVEVRQILMDNSRCVGVETNEGKYGAGTVILATGPWAMRLGSQLGMKIPVQACRTQVGLYRKPIPFGRWGPVYGDFVHGIYFKPTHGEMIHGGRLTGEEIQQPVDPDKYNESADPDWLPAVRQNLCRRYPGMHRSFGRGGYGALYGITPDWHPILDKVPGLEGLYCAVGFSGHGFKMSPIVGQLMTEMIVDGSAHSLDIHSLRLNRFEEKELVQTPYAYGVMG